MSFATGVGAPYTSTLLGAKLSPTRAQPSLPARDVHHLRVVDGSPSVYQEDGAVTQPTLVHLV